jgi:molybdopterin molybdotransferase
VDGYAVRAASTFGASESSPALLTVTGAVAMGEAPRMTVAGGQAVRIATGGRLPEGADGVVMLEHAESLDEGSIEVVRSVAPGQNLIAAGEDFESGARIAAAGRRLRPQDAGVLAAFGRTRVKAFRQPVVGIISTGDEIVPAETTPWQQWRLRPARGPWPSELSATSSSPCTPPAGGPWSNATWC